MKKQKKKFSRPRKPFDKARIEEENILKEKYGLKNKKEIWKADAAIGRIRNLAKQLITASEEEKKAFVERLQKKGFMVESIADALALDKEDWLKRRLQTIVFAKGLANTPKQARQFITHKNVSIGNRTVNIPSYQVSLEEEALVKTDVFLKDKKQKTKVEEIKQEVLEKEQAFGKTLTKTVKEPIEKTEEKPEEIKQEVEASPITS
jgi:small subunit ribosomal protein S4